MLMRKWDVVVFQANYCFTWKIKISDGIYDSLRGVELVNLFLSKSKSFEQMTMWYDQLYCVLCLYVQPVRMFVKCSNIWQHPPLDVKQSQLLSSSSLSDYCLSYWKSKRGMCVCICVTQGGNKQLAIFCILVSLFILNTCSKYLDHS